MSGTKPPADDEILEWKVRATAREIEELIARRTTATPRRIEVDELAAQLDRSVHATYRLLKAGRIPGAFNDGPGTRWFIPSDAIARYTKRGER